MNPAKPLLFILALFSLSQLQACCFIEGSGEIVTEDRCVQSFHRVEVDGDVVVIIDAGLEPGTVLVTADDNLLEYVEVDVDDGLLTVSADGFIFPSEPILVEVGVAEVDRVQGSGSGKVIGRTVATNRQTLKLEVTGSGQIDFAVDLARLETRITGSGAILLEGRVDLHEIEVTGSGDVGASCLKARDTEVHISGSGDVRVTALETVFGQISGSGDLEIAGDPHLIDVGVTGSGDVTRR